MNRCACTVRRTTAGSSIRNPAPARAPAARAYPGIAAAANSSRILACRPHSLARIHRYSSDDQRQLAVPGFEIEAHAALVQHHALLDFGENRLELRRAFRHQSIE